VQDTRNKGKRSPHGNANKGKVYVVKEQARKTDRRRKHMQVQQDDTVPRTPKPVDEDLYKIPPELLHTSNKRVSHQTLFFLINVNAMFVLHIYKYISVLILYTKLFLTLFIMVLQKKIMGFISKCFVQLSCHEHC